MGWAAEHLENGRGKADPSSACISGQHENQNLPGLRKVFARVRSFRRNDMLSCKVCCSATNNNAIEAASGQRRL